MKKKERSQISKIERRRDPNEYFVTRQDPCLMNFVPKRFIYSSLSHKRGNVYINLKCSKEEIEET